VNHPEPDELGVLQARDQPQHARLFAPLHLRLEADQAVVVAGEIVLAQLHDGVGLATGARVARPTGFIGPNRSVSTPRAAITSIGRHPRRTGIVELVQRGLLRRHQRLVEPRVLVAREGAVQVVPFAVVHAAADLARECGRSARRASPRRLRPQRDARKTFERSIVSARTIGLIAS
jgi:hypothetical protein